MKMLIPMLLDIKGRAAVHCSAPCAGLRFFLHCITLPSRSRSRSLSCSLSLYLSLSLCLRMHLCVLMYQVKHINETRLQTSAGIRAHKLLRLCVCVCERGSGSVSVCRCVCG